MGEQRTEEDLGQLGGLGNDQAAGCREKAAEGEPRERYLLETTLLPRALCRSEIQAVELSLSSLGFGCSGGRVGPFTHIPADPVVLGVSKLPGQ